MYFLTNNEDYIVAASSDFLTAIGTRDVCSISATLQNKLITIDKEYSRLSISNKNLEYEYQISTMHSAFGNLNLYTLKTPDSNTKIDENEDENIAYLKKIQEGTVDKKDNEYSIPTIPTLQKETKEETTQVEKITEAKTQEPTVATPVVTNNEIKIPDIPEVAKVADITTENIETTKLPKIEKIESPKVDEIKEISSEETKNEVLEKIEDEKENTLKLDNNDLVNSLKDIDIKEESHTEVKIAKDESIEKLADEIIETKNAKIETQSVEKVDTQSKVNNTQDIDTLLENSKIAEDDELTKDIQSLEDSKPIAKESGLKKITKKLFPWGGKRNDEIELEDNSAYEMNLKSANELENKKEEAIETIKDSIDSAKEIKIESTSEITTAEENDILEKIKTINIENEDTAKATESSIDTPTVELEKEKIGTKKIEKKIDDKLEESIDKLKTSSATLEKSEIETRTEAPKLETQTTLKLDNQNDIENPIVDEEDELAVLKEQMANKNTRPQVEPLQTNVPKTDSENTTNDSNKIAYKLIGIQVDAINLEENANKLSIDSSSYKMLLGNYLDEIDKYNSELESGVTSTIDMLKDAGELLSLNILTKKLEELKTSNKKRAATKEISLIASLLKEKADKKHSKNTEDTNTIVVPEIQKEDVKKELKTTKEDRISIPPIPDEIIDITSAQDLLASISPQSVAFNPNRAADELNLPKTLILEFVEDFISQSKEHLPIIVDAYKKEDVKTIQTTAHMLKGAASNLRLDTIAENLFKIQKESNVNSSGELIKQFVSKLKGLASEVASLEDAEDEN